MPLDPQGGDFTDVTSGSAGCSPSVADMVGDAIMAPHVPVVGSTSIALPSTPIAIKAALPLSVSSSKSPTAGSHALFPSSSSSSQAPKSKAGRDMFAFATRTVW
ncbi:hypothetical protein EW146_g4418 [Bondarzewia mesenterica]|uniref:Uncharacterized protein n=1 Tax=Bondarzewia mesenterica TaxID=1095465 RepID=A0A4S4M0D6_9AGAM|nr:hypothetical protein EW146_g4418 [Bondarzewia mesenterica]